MLTVIRNLNIERVSILPAEADPVLIVDADAVLPLSASALGKNEPGMLSESDPDGLPAQKQAIVIWQVLGLQSLLSCCAYGLSRLIS